MKILYTLTLVALCSISIALGQVIGFDTSTQPGGTNNFGASPLAPSVSDANVDATGFVRGSGVTQTSSGAARGVGGNGFQAATAAAAIAGNRFFTFTVKSNTGYGLTMTSIGTFSYRRSATGPANALIQYSLNGVTFVDIITLPLSSTSNSGATISNTALPAELTDVPSTTTVTFRIVPFGASASGGVFYIFDVANSSAPDLAILGNTPLPVTYLNLAARATESGQVRVSWATTDERSNAFFAVERSSDLRTYTELGRVVGKGTTQVRQEYSLLDEAPALGYNYYRLRQVDQDGMASYSRPIAVLNEALLDAALLVYPNPANSQVHIGLKNTVQAATLISTQGVRRAVTVRGAVLDVSGLPAGVYVLEVQTTTGQVLRQRVMKE
jgi:hypothetical protein